MTRTLRRRAGALAYGTAFTLLLPGLALAALAEAIIG